MLGTIFTADAARAENDKLSCLGAFWTVTKAGPVLADVAFVLRLDDTEVDIKHPVKLALIAVNESEPVLEVIAEIKVSRNPGDHPGPAVATIAVPIGRIEMKAGSYAWRLDVSGQLLDEWHFVVQQRSE